MKKNVLSSLFALLLFNLIACGPTLQVKHDEFKNADIVKLFIDHHTKIDGRRKRLKSRGSFYLKEIIKGETKEISIHFKFYGTTNITAIDKNGFLKVDDKKFELAVGEATVQTKTTVSSNTTQNMNYGTGKMEQRTTTSSSSKNIIQTQVKFSNEIASALKNAKVVVFRLYSEKDPIDIKASKDDIVWIKKFINHNGKKKS